MYVLCEAARFYVGYIKIVKREKNNNKDKLSLSS